MTASGSCLAAAVAKKGAASKEIIGSLRPGLDSEAICQYSKRDLSPRMADLLHIASKAYAVDRTHKRDRRPGGAGRSRTFPVRIEVRDEPFWKRTEISDLLTECLEFLTGDRWELRFTDNSCGSSRLLQRSLSYGDQFPDEPIICLYSGGLDSAAGLANRLKRHVEGEIIPVTVRHRNDLADIVLKQLRLLSCKYSYALRPLIVEFAMTSPSKLGEEESSQRTRSFLFSSVGGAAASTTNASKIEVYESGVGAVNLPLQGMLGAPATRSCHPHFLRLMSRLLSAVANRRMELCLPFIAFTKAELVKALAEDHLEDLARSTVSCVHYPLRDPDSKSCGLCPGCIFRRVALTVAGIDEDDDPYKYDLLGEDTSVLDKERLKYLKAFIIQIDRLSELDSPGRVPRFFRRHLVGTKIVQPDRSMDFFADLFRRYRREWLQFIGYAQAKNLAWAGLLELQDVSPE